jgi:Ca2+:H+ antiporter
VGLVLPAIFSTANPSEDVTRKILKISRGSSVILLAAYFAYVRRFGIDWANCYRYVFFQMRSHHSIYKEVLEMDHHQGGLTEKERRKLTTTEAIIAVTIALTCVSFMAIYLVDEIEWVVKHRHVKDA